MTETTADKWAVPMDVTDLDIAFPANALEYMPAYEECREALRALPAKERARWINFQQTWFFSGLPADVEFLLRDGIDGKKAIRHLRVIQGSFAPKHEHKEEAVAYLASRWFEDVRGLKP